MIEDDRPLRRQTCAATDVPVVTAIRDPVEHLLPMLAQAPSPMPKKTCAVRNSGHILQYLFDDDPGILKCAVSKKSAKDGKDPKQLGGSSSVAVLVCTISKVQQAGPSSLRVGDSLNCMSRPSAQTQTGKALPFENSS
jgi:hypothetical protein